MSVFASVAAKELMKINHIYLYRFRAMVKQDGLTTVVVNV